MQEQVRQLNSQNQEYRGMLLQSANNIRGLLARLPAVEQTGGEIDLAATVTSARTTEQNGENE